MVLVLLCLYISVVLILMPSEIEGSLSLDLGSMSSTQYLGQNRYDDTGRTLSGVGDVNNDSIPDFLISAYGYHGNTGKVYLVYGSNATESSIDLGSLGSSGVTMTSNSYGGYFGIRASPAGDINKDGYQDFVIGASNSGNGEAYLVYGGANLNSTLAINSLGVGGVRMIGESSGELAGCDVAGGADINKDGLPDILIGAYGYNAGGATYTGRAYLVYGRASMPNNMSLSSADVIMTGENADDRAGISVAFAGDVNNDGHPDMLVGAWTYSNSAGRIYLIYGSSSLSSSFSLGAADVILDGEASSQCGYKVASAGDINNDGYDDFLMSTKSFDNSAGRVYLVFGSSSLPNSISLGSLGSAGITITGPSANTQLGSSLATAGDIDKDGYADFLIGCVSCGSGKGAVFLIYGNKSLPSSINTASINTTFRITTLIGSSTTDHLSTAVDAGDIDKDGYPDILLGGFGYNTFTGIAYLVSGASVP